MPIDRTGLEQEILAIIDETKDLEQPQARVRFARALTNAIVNAIKSATVTLPSGSIITTGSATTQTNPNPAQGTLH